MYLQDFISEETPKALPWGDNGQHVVLNIREQTVCDEDGNETTQYLYDCVERVPTPITVANIIKVAAADKFGSDIFDYVAQHLYNADNTTVKSYTSFVSELSEQAQAIGYE